MKKDRKSVYKSYFLGCVVTAIFFVSVLAYLILLMPKTASFLTGWIFLLPLSPFSVVWLYFLFKALIPVTGGMPGKGFKQWFYSYLLLLTVWLYIIGVALALDFFLPTFEKDYTEMIFPCAITAATLLVVIRIPRVNRFMWKIFGTGQKTNDAKQKE